MDNLSGWRSYWKHLLRLRVICDSFARQCDASPHIKTDNNNLVLPFSCSGATRSVQAASCDRLEYSCSHDDGACRSADGQFADIAPRSVTVQPDEQCHTMLHAERVSLARVFCLTNCRRLTLSSLAQYQVCQHWHKPIIPSPISLPFLFLRR